MLAEIKSLFIMDHNALYVWGAYSILFAVLFIQYLTAKKD